MSDEVQQFVDRLNDCDGFVLVVNSRIAHAAIPTAWQVRLPSRIALSVDLCYVSPCMPECHLSGLQTVLPPYLGRPGMPELVRMPTRHVDASGSCLQNAVLDGLAIRSRIISISGRPLLLARTPQLLLPREAEFLAWIDFRATVQSRLGRSLSPVPIGCVPR